MGRLLFVSLHTMNKKIVACLCLLMVAGIEDVCVASAFSGFSAVDADVLQARDSYAQWSQAYNRWEGQMTNFVPGSGYKYYSGDNSAKTLFDDITSQNVLKASRRTQGEQSSGNIRASEN